MNTSFTPGPWVYYTNPITNTSVVAFNADGPPITKQLSEANARLIAASPRMYEALKALAASSRTFRNVPHHKQQWTSFDDDALDEAFAAINLATKQ
jgi:hypothetical protein